MTAEEFWGLTDAGDYRTVVVDRGNGTGLVRLSGTVHLGPYIWTMRVRTPFSDRIVDYSVQYEDIVEVG